MVTVGGTGETKTITNDLQKLNVIGVSDNIIIKSHINSIEITGTNNRVDGLDPNCKVDYILITGLANDVNLNQNCANVQKCITGLNNTFRINGNHVPQNNNYNNNSHVFNGQRIITISSNDNNRGNVTVSHNINDALSQLNNFGINVNFNVNNMNNDNNNIYNMNDDNDDDDENNNNNDFQRKKQQLILEMDEYQYKHIVKYDSRKESSCSICLNDFQGIDIIKTFSHCGHIFHKKCLLEWLKKSNCCPLCKHDLTDDIH